MLLLCKMACKYKKCEGLPLLLPLSIVTLGSCVMQAVWKLTK